MELTDRFYLFQKLMNHLFLNRISFMVVHHPAFLVSGTPHVVKAKKLKSRTEEELIEEIADLAYQASQHSEENSPKIFALYDVKLQVPSSTETTQNDFIADPRYIVRYSLIPMEKE